MGYPLDEETGALPPAALWEAILVPGSDASVVEVVEPTTGHPSSLHDSHGGQAVSRFRRHLVDVLKERTDGADVYRLTANAFGYLSPTECAQRWSITFEGTDVEMVCRRFRFAEGK